MWKYRVMICKKVIWKVVGGHSVEEPKENNDIGLWGLILIGLTRTGWGGKIRIEQVDLFINDNVAIACVLRKSAGNDEY